MRTSKIRNNEKGFTIAEILFVVTIISILIAISAVIYVRSVDKARKSKDLSNIPIAKNLFLEHVYADAVPEGIYTAMKNGEFQHGIVSEGAVVGTCMEWKGDCLVIKFENGSIDSEYYKPGTQLIITPAEEVQSNPIAPFIPTTTIVSALTGEDVSVRKVDDADLPDEYREFGYEFLYQDQESNWYDEYGNPVD